MPITPEERSPDASLPAATEGRQFVVYERDGTPATMSDVLAASGSVDAVLMGEEHDDPLGHRVQYEVLTALYQRYGGTRSLVLSMEMFERDVQTVVDEYLRDLITEEHFTSSSRPWATYDTFYRPMVEFAKGNGVPVVAANAPRRYVNRASRLGRASLEDLPEEARRTLPPLPYPEASPAYMDQWNELMGEAAQHMSSSVIDGQALWDATMGLSLAEALETRGGALVLHLAGAFHIERFTGVPETLQHYRPGSRALVIAVRAVADVRAFDPASHEGLGDFVILTDEGAKSGS